MQEMAEVKLVCAQYKLSHPVLSRMKKLPRIFYWLFMRSIFVSTLLLSVD